MVEPTTSQKRIFANRWYLGKQTYFGAGHNAYSAATTYTIVNVTTVAEFRTAYSAAANNWITFDSSLDGTTMNFATTRATRNSRTNPCVVDARGRDITFQGQGASSNNSDNIVWLNVKMDINGSGNQNNYKYQFNGCENVFMAFLEFESNDDDDTMELGTNENGGNVTMAWSRFNNTGQGGSNDRHYINASVGANSSTAPTGPGTIAFCYLENVNNRGPTARGSQIHVLGTYYDDWGSNGAANPKSDVNASIDGGNVLVENSVLRGGADTNNFTNTTNDPNNDIVCDVVTTGSGACLVDPESRWNGSLNEIRPGNVWTPGYEYNYVNLGTALADYATTIIEPRADNILQITMSGTLDTSDEDDVSTKTIILTLPSSQSWVASGATFNAQRQNIIDSLYGYSEGSLIIDGGDMLSVVTGVVRTSDQVVTITLDTNPTINGTVEVHWEGSSGITGGNYLATWNVATVNDAAAAPLAPPLPRGAGANIKRGRRVLA